jgi:hypothetical protein
MERKEERRREKKRVEMERRKRETGIERKLS